MTKASYQTLKTARSLRKIRPSHGHLDNGRFFNYMRMTDFSSLSTFGSRERFIAGELLIAWSNEEWTSPSDHLEDNVTLEFNPSSGYVFLVDEDYNVVMLNNDNKLENWLTCRDCDEEGFRSEVEFTDEGLCSDCNERINCCQDEYLLEPAMA